MNNKEGEKLLNNYPLASKKIKEWFEKKMIESFKDKEVPEAFKQGMLEEGVSNERLGVMIDNQPRFLFDVFDENEIFISISYVPKTFLISINENNTFPTNLRKEGEIRAIKEAFKLLEEKLKPLEFPNL